MDLHKNVAAKIAALAASVLALVAGWALVRQDPPPQTDAGGLATVAASPAPALVSTDDDDDDDDGATAPAPQPARRADTRTRTS